MQKKPEDLNSDNNISKDNLNKELDFESINLINDKFSSTFESFILQLNELNKIVSAGPFISLINDPNININNLREYGNLLLTYQVYLNKHLTMMVNSYFKAVNKIATSMQGKDPSEVRKILINSFEEVYSNLFESSEYSINFNNLINSLIDLNKNYQSFLENSSLFTKRQSLSKDEKDLLFYNLYEIKKISLEIKNKLNEIKK